MKMRQFDGGFRDKFNYYPVLLDALLTSCVNQNQQCINFSFYWAVIQLSY